MKNEIYPALACLTSTVDRHSYEGLLATACDLDEYKEGIRARREFIIANNPYNAIRTLVEIDEITQ